MMMCVSACCAIKLSVCPMSWRLSDLLVGAKEARCTQVGGAPPPNPREPGKAAAAWSWLGEQSQEARGRLLLAWQLSSLQARWLARGCSASQK